MRITRGGLLKSSDAAGAYPSMVQQAVFPVDKYGTVDTTGATDSSAAVLAAITACSNAGGGTVLFPAGTIRCDSQIVIPNDGHSTIPRQAPIRLRGAGRRIDGSWETNGTVPSATTLDLRATTAPGKIATYGLGSLSIEDVTLTQFGSAADTTPFIYSTNTTIFPWRASFVGHSSLSGSACVQDAIVLGGTASAAYDGTAAGAFQGYGTTIQNCYFARIRRALWGRVWANSIRFIHNTVSNTCGATNAAACVQFDGTVGFAKANLISGNLFEIGGYVYVVRFTASGSNLCEGNQHWDSTGSLLAVYLLEGNATACGGNYIRDAFTGPAFSQWLVDSTTGTTYFLAGGSTSVGLTMAGGHDQNLVRPAVATANENARLLNVKRSAAEATSPDLSAFNVQQNGAAFLGGSWSANANFQVTNGSSNVGINHNSIVAGGAQNLDIYSGTGSNRIVNIARGTLVVSHVATASRPSASAVGAGAHLFDTTLGKPIWSNGTNWVDATGTTV